MMTQREALEILAPHRRNSIVVSTMSAAGIWPTLSDTPLDFAYLPSSMGQGIALGLGLALAQPTRAVIVLMGDGSLLMNLGSLVTVANYPTNLRVLLLENGLYEVTGGQTVVGAGQTNFVGLARSAGIARVYRFEDVEGWKAGIAEVLNGPGPMFVWLKVAGERSQKTPLPPRPMAEQISRLRSALSVTS